MASTGRDDDSQPFACTDPDGRAQWLVRRDDGLQARPDAAAFVSADIDNDPGVYDARDLGSPAVRVAAHGRRRWGPCLARA